MAAAEAGRQAARESRIAIFTGDCSQCFDEGPCRFCDRGQRQIARDLERTIRDALVEAGVTPRCIDFSFDSYPNPSNPALAAILAYLGKYDGKRGLILTGRYGTGKTGLLVGGMRALVTEGLRDVRFLTGPDLFDLLRQGYDKGDGAARLEKLRAVRLLVIDDLGAERPTEWTHERIFTIINHRYENQFPTWVTTNCDMEALSQRIGERSVWRLVETSDVIEVGGANLRAKK